MSRDRSLDEFVDETPESDATEAESADADTTESESTDTDTTDTESADADTAEADADATETTDADTTETAAEATDEPSPETDTGPDSGVVLPDPDDLDPLRPTLGVDPDGTCSDCGATATTRWWDETAAGYVCADCKEW